MQGLLSWARLRSALLPDTCLLCDLPAGPLPNLCGDCAGALPRQPAEQVRVLRLDSMNALIVSDRLEVVAARYRLSRPGKSPRAVIAPAISEPGHGRRLLCGQPRGLDATYRRV